MTATVGSELTSRMIENLTNAGNQCHRSISFRSHNGDVSSYHVWHLGFDAAVFGLLGFFQTALGWYPSARILAFTRAQSLHWNKALGPHAGISFYSQELVLPCLFT